MNNNKTPAESARGIEILHLKPITKGALRGIAKVRMPSGLIMAEVQILQSNGKCWANPPSKPIIDKDGIHLKDANGKPRYLPLAEFDTKELRDRFSNAVIATVRAQNPELLQ